MNRAKVAITLERDTLTALDRMVAEHRFPNRSQAIEAAVSEKLLRIAKTRLATECAKLDPREEIAMAEEGMATELAEWPAY